MKTMKKPPIFKTEKQESDFWLKTDSSDYVDWGKGTKAIFTNLKPSLKTISLRLPEMLIAELKMLANKKDVPYQTLLKTFLAERVEREMSTIR
jgi:predicted DNA binding CopG/RHH family protein